MRPKLEPGHGPVVGRIQHVMEACWMSQLGIHGDDSSLAAACPAAAASASATITHNITVVALL